MAAVFDEQLGGAEDVTGGEGGEERAIPGETGAEIERQGDGLILAFGEPEAHAVEAQGGGGADDAAVATAGVIAVTMGDPGGGARLDVIEPEVDFGEIDAGFAIVDLDAGAGMSDGWRGGHFSQDDARGEGGVGISAKRTLAHGSAGARCREPGGKEAGGKEPGGRRQELGDHGRVKKILKLGLQ